MIEKQFIARFHISGESFKKSRGKYMQELRHQIRGMEQDMRAEIERWAAKEYDRRHNEQD